MAKICPITKEKVVSQECVDCDEKCAAPRVEKCPFENTKKVLTYEDCKSCNRFRDCDREEGPLGEKFETWCGASCANYECYKHPVNVPRTKGSYSTKDMSCDKRYDLTATVNGDYTVYSIGGKAMTAKHVFAVLGCQSNLKDYSIVRKEAVTPQPIKMVLINRKAKKIILV